MSISVCTDSERIDAAPRRVRPTRLKVAALSTKGPRNPVNQDAYLALPQYGVFAVADGVGGRSFGAVASKMALGIISEYVQDRRLPGEGLGEAIRRANLALHDLAKPGAAYASMATTLVLAWIAGAEAMIFNVGDSRAYLLGTDGIEAMTRDHSAYDEKGRKGICRAIGYAESVDVDISTLRLEQDEMLLLVSDGITDSMTDQELYDFFQGSRHKTEALQRIVESATEKGGDDDKTILVVHQS